MLAKTCYNSNRRALPQAINGSPLAQGKQTITEYERRIEKQEHPLKKRVWETSFPGTNNKHRTIDKIAGQRSK